MEYFHTYDINRKMHARPCVKVIQTVNELHKKHKGLCIKLEKPNNGKEINCESIIELLTIDRLFHIGGKIKVIARGGYPIEILKDCTNRIGGIFAFKDTSLTVGEILYKNEYGHYPEQD